MDISLIHSLSKGLMDNNQDLNSVPGTGEKSVNKINLSPDSLGAGRLEHRVTARAIKTYSRTCGVAILDRTVGEHL